MIFWIGNFNSPTKLTWEEKNTGDYRYTPQDFSKIDKFFKDFENQLKEH